MNSIKRGKDIILQTTNKEDATFQQCKNLFNNDKKSLAQIRRIHSKRNIKKNFIGQTNSLKKYPFKADTQRGNHLGDSLFSSLPDDSSKDAACHKIKDNCCDMCNFWPAVSGLKTIKFINDFEALHARVSKGSNLMSSHG